MEAKILQDVFIKILRSELNETELNSDVKDQLTPDVISALYLLSKRHDLAHIISSSLYKNGLLTDEEMLSKYSHEEAVSIYRYENMRYAYEQICGTFDKAFIPYIPLKGSVIRPYYPKENMRTSCDIDILVKEENLDAAIDALTQKGFRCSERNYHDVSLYSPNNIHLELHFNIQENIDTLDAVLKDAWTYATFTKGCCYAFSKEFFLFHVFAHMSYHFLSGGCGIRSLMDIWIIDHKMGIRYSQAKDLLEKACIYQFATEITNLVEACFSGKHTDEFSEELLSYIFKGGTYGSIDNHITINNSHSHVTLSYVAKRIFVSNKDMAIEYPTLKKVPILFVFCWLHRTIKLSIRLLKRLFEKKKIQKNISDKQIEKIKKMRTRLGL